MANQKQDADIMALFCLGCVAQYFGFVAGPMDLWLFDPDKTEHEPTLDVRTHRADAKRVYEGLSEQQRPRLHFIESAEQVAAVPQKKAVVNPMDFLDGHAPLVDQAVHWDLMSKRSLALSDLPSPPTEVVDTRLRPDQVRDEILVAEEVARMLERIETHALPFVVKLPMGLGGHAVFMVRDVARRESCLQVLREELPSMLRALTAENETLTPPSLLLQQVVPGETVGVSLFVTKAGRAVFLSCADQIIDEGDNWAGGVIDYACQDTLASSYRDTIELVAAYAYQRGYYGPMGVDVMTDEAGRQLIVDMNIRQTGDLTLGLLGKHFWEEHGLPYAGLIPAMSVQGDREQFETTFAEYIECGALVIVGWCRAWAAGPEGDFVWSTCSLIAGAKDKVELKLIMDRVGSVSMVVKES